MGTDTMSPAAGGPAYLLGDTSPAAAQRHAALSAIFDGWTFRRLDAVGIATGWRCWEVGAGGPSVPAWLVDRTGTEGAVLASDVDPSGLHDIPGVVALRHDVGEEASPGCGFDLVHARLVLTHVPRRAAALRRMAGALRPGGWIVVEDFDVSAQPLACPDAADDDEDRANRVRAGFIELLAGRGVDLNFGRTLRRRLRALGLGEIGVEAYAPVAIPETRALELANVVQVRDQLAAIGLGPDIEPHLAAVSSGLIDVAVPPLVTAWGRRPERGGAPTHRAGALELGREDSNP